MTCWLASPRLHLLVEGEGYWDELKAILGRGKITGPRVHDARIAAVCLTNGAEVLWTCDRDFSRIEGLEICNPLITA